MTLPANSQSFISFSQDYESFTEYLPQQLKQVKIIQDTNKGVITEETLIFSTVFKKEIQQQSLHYQKSENNLITEILSGPAKNSIIDVTFSPSETGTKILIKISLKISLKYKILQPLITKWYKLVLQGILFKMNQKILLSASKQSG